MIKKIALWIVIVIASLTSLSAIAVGYGYAKAHQVCGQEENALLMGYAYMSLNPLSGEVFKKECRKLNRHY